jgi:hypothetical protein
MKILRKLFGRRKTTYRQAPPLAYPAYLAVHIADVSPR